MLQKKKKKKKKRGKEGPNKRTDRQGSKRAPTLAILLRFERNKKREGDMKKRRLLSFTRSGAERNERRMQQER
jgi:hypothetical protein